MLRKGAIDASEGRKVVIPFNMRDGIAICIGKGNEKWLNTAPHGAGRIISVSFKSIAPKEADIFGAFGILRHVMPMVCQLYAEITGAAMNCQNSLNEKELFRFLNSQYQKARSAAPELINEGPPSIAGWSQSALSQLSAGSSILSVKISADVVLPLIIILFYFECKIASALVLSQGFRTRINQVVDGPAPIMILKTFVYRRNTDESGSVQWHNIYIFRKNTRICH